MSFWLAVLAATVGNLVGSLIAYGIGCDPIGRPDPWRRPAHAPLGENLRRARPAHHLHRSPLPLTRTFISLPAGTRHVPILPFVVLTTIGSALWASGFIMIGLVSGSAWAAVSSVLGKVLLAFGIALVGWLTFRAAHRDSAN